MENETFAKGLTVAVWLAFAIILLGMVAGALLPAPAAVPIACVRQGLLHPGPKYPEIGRAF